MAGSTIDGKTVNQGITLGAVSSYPTYASPLTITNAGAVYSGTASSAIYGPNTSAWSVYNYGSVQGGSVKGILLQSGGDVVNGSAAYATASIAGYTGVEIDGAAGTVTNAGLIDSTGTGPSGNAVAMTSGGTVSNAFTGTISGGFDAAFILGGAGTVTNYGTIRAGADGVALINGGLVENLATGPAGGQMDVSGYGVRVLNAAGTVVNSGTIATNGPQQVGVYLGAGGTVTNSAAGYIYNSGGGTGVRVAGASGIVVNSGIIGQSGKAESEERYGVDLRAGGSVTNNTGGSIYGYRYGVKLAGGTSVTNQASATISGDFGVYAAGVRFGLFSTGNGLTTDGKVDPHWTFTNSATTANALVANNPGTDFYVGTLGWVSDTSSSSWIVDNTVDPSSNGLSSLLTTVDLTGFDPNTAVLNGSWALDNAGYLELNGHVISDLSSPSAYNGHTLHGFSIYGASGDFLPGVNTLSVVFTTADGSFDGANVQITNASANPIGATANVYNAGTILGTTFGGSISVRAVL